MVDLYPDCATRPRVYAIPAGMPFARAFACGLRDRLRRLPPDLAARTQVFVSGVDQVSILQRAFREAFATGFLPAAHSMRNIEADPAIALPTPPGASRRHRLLVLSRLVAAFLKRQGDLASGGESVFLAARLGALLDDLHAEGVDAAALLTAAPPDLATHWESASRFLALIGETWPAYLHSQGRDDPTKCRSLAVEAILQQWQARPPRHPVLVAGSTATDATSRRFVAAVANLPHGAIVLPGLDKELDDDAWNSVADPEEPAPGHPQYSMRRLLDALEFDRGAVGPWLPDPPPRPARTRFLAQALRPAPVTEAWRREAEEYDAIAMEAMRGVELIEAASADEEAAAIAVALREAADTPGLRAAFVTEDNELRQRVMAKCERWSLRPDDRRGTSLAATPYGRFALETARVALGPPDLATLFGLLKDLHVRAGSQREAHERCASLAERILRGTSAQLPGIDGVREAVQLWAGYGETRTALAAELVGWLADIEEEWAPLTEFGSREAAPFQDLLEAHLQVLDRLEAAPAPSPSRAAVRREFEALWEEAPAMGDVVPAEYLVLVAELLIQSQGGFVPPGGHPRISIESTLSARFDPPDLIVFGGLNEDIAPGGRGEDPWLNRTMRESLGLPPPERAIGTLAHDAAELFAADRVVLSRAARTAGEARVASRWLLRLVNLLQGTGPQGEAALQEMRTRGGRRLALARSLERPAGRPRPAPSPNPRPPVHARPRRLSATQIERLLKDPYSIYAEKILALRPLEPLGATPDARLRGMFAHQVLARYLQDGDALLRGAAALQERLLSTLEDEAEALSALGWPERWPWLPDLWKEGMAAVSRWLAEHDSARFAVGWRPQALEATGSLVLEAPSGPFEIVARADRVDIRSDGGGTACRLFDYKIGGPPHLEREIGTYLWDGPAADGHGWAWQLGIAALIAREGGFQGLAPVQIEGAEYIGLRGPEPGEGETADAFEKHGGPEQGLQALRDSLEELISAYDDPDTPYGAWTLPDARKQRWANPYDHLSRFAEWAASGTDDDGEGDG